MITIWFEVFYFIHPTNWRKGGSSPWCYLFHNNCISNTDDKYSFLFWITEITAIKKNTYVNVRIVVRESCISSFAKKIKAQCYSILSYYLYSTIKFFYFSECIYDSIITLEVKFNLFLELYKYIHVRKTELSR